MIRCWRLLLVLVLLLLAGGLALLPQVRWPVYGWLKGKHFYQGMPASWWEREVDENYEPYYGHWSTLMDNDQGDLTLGPLWPVGWSHTKPTSTGEWFRQWVGGAPRGRELNDVWYDTALTNGDAAAVPVLLELLESDHAKVRQLAVFALAQQGSLPPETVPALAAAVLDPDEGVCSHAQLLLKRLDAEAAAKATVEWP